MKNFSSLVESVSLTKQEFAYVTGITPYRLRCCIKKDLHKLQRLGYSQYDKTLMPPVVSYLLQKYGLQLNEEQLKNVLRGQVGTIVR